MHVWCVLQCLHVPGESSALALRYWRSCGLTKPTQIKSNISVLFFNTTWDTKIISDRWADPHLQAQSCHSRTRLDKYNTAHTATPEMLPPRQNINRHYRPFLWDYAYAAGSGRLSRCSVFCELECLCSLAPILVVQ